MGTDGLVVTQVVVAKPGLPGIYVSDPFYHPCCAP